MILPDGNSINYIYSNGDLQKVTYPDQSSRTFEYSIGYLSGIKDENQKYIAKYSYDSKYRVATSSVDGTNEKLVYSYVDNKHTEITDALGRKSTYTFDRSGGKSIPTIISGQGCTECGQSAVSYTYDSALNVTSATDANGNITTFTYDGNGNMLTKTEAYGTPQQRMTTFTYDPQLNVITSIKDPMENITIFEYDPQGNLVLIYDADENETKFIRDTRGQITGIIDAEMKTIGFTYDQFGNIAKMTDELGNTTSYTYDIMGNLLSTLDAQDNATSYTHDQRGRITQIRDSLNQLTAYSYDPGGNVTALTDPKGNQTQFIYDGINRLIKEIDPLSKQKSFTYDVMSNLKTKTDANATVTTYTYDAHNRVITVGYADGTNANFTYDSNGNIITAANPNITYTFSHDHLNRKTTVTDSLNRTLNYAYDVNSNKTSVTNPGGSITYVYNNLNRLTTISESAGSNYTFGYNVLGRRTSLSYPNGVTTTYAYDSAGRLTNLLNRKSYLTAQLLSSYSYSHDKVGNRRSLTDLLGIHDYSYDLIYRLLQANHPDQPNEQYSYDPVGNRQGTTVDTGNRLLQDVNYTYSYDNNGNLIQKINRTTSQLTTYGYDPENRLVQVTFPDMTVSYKYDLFGRRIEKNINGAITRYLYDDEDIIVEYDGNNQIVGRYTHGPGTDEPLSMKKNKQKYYYHFDGLGSVTGMTDNSGNLIQEYSYDSFGKIQNSLAPDLKQPYGYTGREWDEELGLYFYRARYYDPASGRFLTQDPIEFKGGINFYAYVGGNPVNRIDPTGLKVFLCKRPANFAWGLVDHHWIKTDTVEAGQGERGGGIPGQASPSSLLPETEIAYHPGESTKPGVSCKEIKCIDESCVNKKLIIGTPLGEWNPLTNNCQIFAFNVLAGCAK